MRTSVMLFDDEMMNDPAAETASEPLPEEDKEDEFDDDDDDDEDKEDLPDEDEEE